MHPVTRPLVRSSRSRSPDSSLIHSHNQTAARSSRSRSRDPGHHPSAVRRSRSRAHSPGKLGTMKKAETNRFILFHSKSKELGPNYTSLGFPKDTAKILSNFHEGTELRFRGDDYVSVENAFQGQKYACLLHPESPIQPSDFAKGGKYGHTAMDAKKAGGKGFMSKQRVALDIRRWNEISHSLMRELIEAKVGQDTHIQRILQLCSTHNVQLFHHSRSDMLWGCHVDQNSGQIKKGENLLGAIFMDIAHRIST